VPEGWTWTRLASVLSLSSGKSLKVRQLTSEEEFPVYGGNGINGTHSDYNVDSDTIIIGRVGFYCGNVYKTSSKAWVTDNALIAAIKEKSIFDIDFLVAVLKYLDLGKTSVSTAQPVVSGKGILPLIVPVPPKIEQNRILKSYIQIMPVLDLIENNKEEVLSLISMTKSKILDLAIRGQLVPQDPNDEPASVLLERIRAEKEELIKAGKIKRDKKESIIFKGDDNSYYEKIGDKIRCIDAEIPFDLPELWTFARLKHIGGIVGGGTPKTNISKYWDGNIPWLTPADLSGYDSMYISTGSRTITDFGLKSSSAQMLPANSILYSSRAPIGYTAIATIPVCTNQGFKSVVPYDFSMSPYLYYCLRARTDNIIQRATGTTFKEISGSEMAETIIPIPPLNEQSKIIEKVTQLQEVISLIEKSLN
jgi:type I restriction enzyme S subunit